MAITLEDKKAKARLDRSRGIMSKINIVKSKNGSTSPVMDSQSDQDTFNSKMLFGQSGNENITWGMPGPEGLIRIYYHIIQNLTGVVRTNMIANDLSGSCTSASLNDACRKLTKGQGNQSAFFINGGDDETKMLGMRGEWNLSGSPFTNNIWSPDPWSVPPGFKFTYPHDSSCASDLIDSLNGVLGYKSPIGRNRSEDLSVMVGPGVLGQRFTDIYPFTQYGGESSGGGGGGTHSQAPSPFKTEAGSGVNNGGGWTFVTPITYVVGDGTWDYLQGARSGPISHNFDAWNSSISSLINQIIAKLSDSITFLNYSKMTNFTYLMSKKAIPGWPSYAYQNDLIAALTANITTLQGVNNYLASRGGNGTNSTPSQYRSEINSYLDATLIPTMNSIKTTVNNIASQCDANMGAPTTKLTLRWLRCECVKAIIDMNGGSRMMLIGIDMAGGTIQKQVDNAQRDFDLYGMDSSEWIPIPTIVGIEQHMGFNRKKMELEVDGYIVAWFGQDHCTSYDVWKSIDYSPDTKIGTWQKIIPPGNSYTCQDIDINSGRVLSYIIDQNIDLTSGTSPYYKVKAYDSGGSGEFARDPATSLPCDPMSGADFPTGGDAPAAVEVVPPRDKIATSPLTSVRMPGGIYKWPTVLKGSNAKDFENRVFESEVDFDSWGSNLTVYHNGIMVEQGLEDPLFEKYLLVDSRKIIFFKSIPLEDEIVLHVFFNIAEMLKEFEQAGGSPGFDTLKISQSYWRDPVAAANSLPSMGNTAGDIRLVIGESRLYRWTGQSWVVIVSDSSGSGGDGSGSSGGSGGSGTDGTGTLRGSVTTKSELPTGPKPATDLYLVENEGKFYAWDSTANNGAGDWAITTKTPIGINSGATFWKAPVDTFEDLPLFGNINGDIRLVLVMGNLYRWSGLDSRWILLVDGSPFDQVKATVESLDALPLNTSPGDLYYVKSEGAYYEYVDPPGEWRVSDRSVAGGSVAGAGVKYWKKPVNYFEELPLNGNTVGDVRLVMSTREMYEWDSDSISWLKITGGTSGSDSGYLKSPVDLYSLLPSQSNNPGDIRYVYETRKLYLWNATLSSWSPIKGEIVEAEINHDHLMDMPDDKGIIPGHDGRYYTKFQLDDMMNQINNKLAMINNLIPVDALDLSGNLLIKGTPFRKGYLSGGNNQRFNTLVANKSYEKIFKSDYFTLSNPDKSKYFRRADKGELRLYINDTKVSTFDLLANFEESKRKYGQSYCPKTSDDGIIKIISVIPYNDFADYQLADFEVKVPRELLAQGENNIYVQHFLSSSESYNTYLYTVFYDMSSNSIAFNNLSITESSLISTKYESGVRYYSTNDEFNIGFDVSHLFDNTYLDNNQVKTGFTELGIPEEWLSLHSNGVFGVPKGNIGDIMRYSGKQLITIPETYTINPSAYLSGYRVFDNSIDYKKDFSFFINTRSSVSTSTREYFKDETYRMTEKSDYNIIPKKIINNWNSTNVLTSGQLQVFDSQLIYPSRNFLTNVLPSQIANYSSYTGTRYYVRTFMGTVPKNNGIFTIGGFNRARNDVLIEIKLPSITGWMSLNKLYNEADFIGADGDGCLVTEDVNSFTFNWTSGQFSTVHSNFTIVIRISMLDKNAIPLDNIFLIDW